MDLFQLFMKIGEPFAAGLFEEPTRSTTYRHANAYRRFWENAALSAYDGGRLYPCGYNIRRNDENREMSVVPDYSFSYSFDGNKMKRKSGEAFDIMDNEAKLADVIDSPHTVGGNGYTHCFPNYKRLLAEGLQGVEKRVLALPDDDFKDGMLVLLDGIRTYHSRCLALLKECNADEKLIAALEKVPENPPTGIYEALVAWNFIYYIDGCDDIGALDRNLLPYWNGEDITELLRELFSHVDINDGWSGPLGPHYNEITKQCIRAIHNGRRPNLQLLVTDSMPDEIWEEVCASLATSCGQPALYNYELYMKNLRRLRPDVSGEDWERLAFGGCTETMLEGISAVGSDDAGINTALIFDGYMRRCLTACASFETFYDGLVAETRDVIKKTLLQVNDYRIRRAKYRSQPVHTLFVDDCIANRKDFNDGGARYYWSVANVAGLINVVESLSVIKTLVYDEKKYTASEFLEKLDAGDAGFLRDAENCPKYGVDDDRCDTIAAAFAENVYDAFSQVPCYPSGKYYPVSNQFTTYTWAGRGVKATPDGRRDGAPLCDSMSAIHAHDTKGPTAMLRSVAKMPLQTVIGTPITNIRIGKENLPKILKPLVKGFFALGGMQLQVSCLSREEILDAMAHPEKHKNLVVRIGGFSEYFTRLDRDMQETVLERTEY